MKLRTLAVAVIALSSVSAVAGASSSSRAGQPLSLAQAVAQLESRYPGEVIAIVLDAAGDKRAHYHVDMRFPKSGLARLDVDAVTLEVASRDTLPLAGGYASLSEAASLIAAHVPGHVTFAELDSMAGVAAHYDVDVQLPQGAIARLKLDPATRQIAWRTPAIVE